LNGLPLNGLPINGLPLNALPLNALPLTTPGGWEAALAGTSLAGLPLQTITLQQVLALPSPQPAAIAHLTLGELDMLEQQSRADDDRRRLMRVGSLQMAPASAAARTQRSA